MYPFQVAPGESTDEDNYCFLSFGTDTSDFLTIGTKNDSNKNVSVLVVTDHFARYTPAHVMPKQTALKSG